jgi:hypothetical protein
LVGVVGYYLWVREELVEAASLFLEATAKGCHSVKRFGVVERLWLASPEKT